MKTLTALKAKAEQARSSHAYRAEGASIRFTEDLVAFTTYCAPCFIDSKEIPGDLNGIISINMPKVFTDIMAGEIGIISRINFTEGENMGKSLVSIDFFRSENVVKGGLLSKMLQ